jgi:diaminopimelate epimerase
LGNDFILIDDLAGEIDGPEAVEWFCDRNFGIGADGLMLLRPATVPDADFAWWFRNSDGSVAEMCGNGIRCFAKYVADHGYLPDDRDIVRIETALGVIPIELTRAYDGSVYMATVDMGMPSLAPADIPTTLVRSSREPGRQLPARDGAWRIQTSPAFMGNPHCVIFVDDVDSAPVRLGQSSKPRRNFRTRPVEFAQIAPDDRIRPWSGSAGWARPRVRDRRVCGELAAALNCSDAQAKPLSSFRGELAIRLGREQPSGYDGPAVEVFSAWCRSRRTTTRRGMTCSTGRHALECPVPARMVLAPGSLRCATGHSFDVAKEDTPTSFRRRDASTADTGDGEGSARIPRLRHLRRITEALGEEAAGGNHAGESRSDRGCRRWHR